MTTDATSVTGIEVVPIPTLRGIAVLEGTMDELLTDPDEATTASYVSITVTDDARPERMVARIREVYPHALVVVHRPAQAPSLHARAGGARLARSARGHGGVLRGRGRAAPVGAGARARPGRVGCGFEERTCSEDSVAAH